MVGTWRERTCEYSGRSHGRVRTIKHLQTRSKACREKSAEVIVCDLKFTIWIVIKNTTTYNPLADNSVGVIRYTTNEVSKVSIPYSKEMGGTITEAPPFTGNGFTKATNGEIIPEFKCDGYF